MLARLPRPAGAPLLQPDIAAGELAIGEGHPSFNAEARGFQLHILLHPLTQPGFDVHVIGLHPYFAVIQQPLVITQIHPHLHHAMLSVQAGETDLAFRTVPLFAVEPGKLRDRQFGTLS